MGALPTCAASPTPEPEIGRCAAVIRRHRYIRAIYRLFSTSRFGQMLDPDEQTSRALSSYDQLQSSRGRAERLVSCQVPLQLSLAACMCSYVIAHCRRCE